MTPNTHGRGVFPVTRRPRIEQPPCFGSGPLIRRLPKGSAHRVHVHCRGGHVLGREGRRANASLASRQACLCTISFAPASASCAGAGHLRWTDELSRLCPKHNHAAASTDSGLFLRSARSRTRPFGGSVEATCAGGDTCLRPYISAWRARTPGPRGLLAACRDRPLLTPGADETLICSPAEAARASDCPTSFSHLVRFSSVCPGFSRAPSTSGPS